MDDLYEVSPPGWSGTTRAMKKHKEITNPWALSWWMKKRGAKPHYKPEPSKKPKHKRSFKEWIEDSGLLEAEIPNDYKSRANLIVVQVGYKGAPDYEPDPEDVMADYGGKESQHYDSKRFNNLTDAAKFFREKIYEVKKELDDLQNGSSLNQNRIVHISMTYYQEDQNHIGVPREITLAYWNRSGLPGQLKQVQFNSMMDRVPNIKAAMQMPREAAPTVSRDMYQKWLQSQQDLSTDKTVKWKGAQPPA